MKKTNTPTRSTDNAHEGQTPADTNLKTDYSGTGPYRCDRKRELAKRYQVQVPRRISEPTGITCPVFLAEMVYIDFVKTRSTDQDIEDRLRDILIVVHVAIQNEPPEQSWICVPYTPRGWKTAKPVRLVAALGPFDRDDPQPTITVMYPYPDYDPFSLQEDYYRLVPVDTPPPTR